MNPNASKYFISLILTAACLSGCAVGEAPGVGFIDRNLRQDHPDIPFQRVWIDPEMSFKNYRSVYIAPVSVDYVIKSESWKAVEKSGDAMNDLREAADHMRDLFIMALKENPSNRFAVASHPSSGTLSLEMALVELVPNSPVMKTASLIPLYGLAATAVDAADPNTVAFEARIRDGGSGKIVMTFADRRREKGNIVSVKNFTYYSHAYTLMSDWAKEFVEVMNKRPDETVKKSSGFELKPW
jgi:hypothetical protein